MTIEELCKQLEDAEGYERFEAVEALGELGPAAEDAVPKLAVCLNCDDDDLKYLVADSLRKIGTPLAKGILVEVAVPMFIDQLEHEDPFLRSDAAIALGEIGPDAAMAEPMLLKALEEMDTELAFHAVEALREIGSPTAMAAVDAFAKAHVPILSGALQLEDEEEREFAIFALKKIGSPEALQILESNGFDV